MIQAEREQTALDLPDRTSLPATRAEIHLDRYEANLAALGSIVGPRTEVVPVVKAGGYGHGAVALGKAATSAGCSMLAVYTLQEGIELRAAGIDAQILVLGPVDPSLAGDCVRHRLQPNLVSMALAEAVSRNAVKGSTRTPFHLEIDTGLSRYGIAPGEALAFCQALDKLPGIRREGLFTHFARADEAADTKVGEQLQRFARVRETLEGAGLGFPGYHAANSAAALRYPEARLDLVRCGIATYGYAPSPHVPGGASLSPVMEVKSMLVRVHTVETGTGVSYGHDWAAPRPSVIGLVPFGYADGLPRSVQGNGRVLVRGTAAPIVGRVAMDQIMVDLTEIEGVAVGDEAVIIGAQGQAWIGADDVALWAGTISYEILAGIGPRVPRVYLRNGRSQPTE